MRLLSHPLLPRMTEAVREFVDVSCPALTEITQVWLPAPDVNEEAELASEEAAWESKVQLRFRLLLWRRIRALTVGSACIHQSPRK